VRLKEQPSYEFEYKTKIKVRDINYGGHLGNDSLISILHEARIELLQELGYTELDLGDKKTGIIMSDLAVNYKKEAFLHDLIKVYTHIDEIKNFTFRMFHKVVRGDDLLALAEIGIVTYNYIEKAPVQVPVPFIKAIEYEV
jgi:acyl-CoA thioester hydrolase